MIRNLAGAALIAVVCLVTASSALADETYSGTVYGCSYKLDADTSADTFSATVSGCKSAIDPTGEIDGSWRVISGQTAVSLDSATVSVLGQDRQFDLGYHISLPFDLDQVTDKAQTFQKVLGLAEGDVLSVVADALASESGSGVPSALQPFSDLVNDLAKACAGKDGSIQGTQPVDNTCIPGAITPAPGSKPQPVDEYVPNDGALGDGQGDKADSSNPDQQSLCPAINEAQKDAVFVCVPAFVTGDLKAGKKPLVIIGGGALLMIPSPLTGTSTISSKVAVVGLGGAVVGYGVKIKAPAVALAGGAVEAIQGLQLSGNSISLGSIDGANLLKGIPSLPVDWNREITDHIHASINAPELIGGSVVKVTAKNVFDLARSSKIDGSGRGSHGADWATGFNPTGETAYYGGSHGGLGGAPGETTDGQFYDYWNTKEGRSPTFDSPFHPTRPGDGGGGSAGDALGLPGGGIVQLDTHAAQVTVDGTIDVTGYDAGNWDGNGDHGAAGAGGSVYVEAKKLSGSGMIDADGGSFCRGCVDSFGGGGGGGRIAVLYASSHGWKGRMHAYGGRDQHYPGPSAAPGMTFLGSGGAGTVFTQAVKWSKKGKPSSIPNTSYPAGTMTIDGGGAPGGYPPPDGTPLANSWSSTKRHLVITGEARVYGRKLDYKRIDVDRGATLTTGIDGSKQQIPSELTVKAGVLSVDRTSRVSLTGRGLAGGSGDSSDSRGGAPPGRRPSTLAHGGSHGGAGGGSSLPGGQSGSTYDSVSKPSLPGGGGAADPEGYDGNPGGGVLDVTASELLLAGTISADGESGEGPTRIDPVPHDFAGGAGAGGSVYVKVGKLSGTGALTALGGDTCAAADARPLPGAVSCNDNFGESGGGGGGRVAVIAQTRCGWHGTLSAAGGTNWHVDHSESPADAQRFRGAAGSTYFPKPETDKCGSS